MIRNFKCKQTERLFNREGSRNLPRVLHRNALRKLLLLHTFQILNEIRSPPGNRLEKLSGRRKGQYSIRINDQWRICFRWKNGDAFDVEIVVYHT